MDIFLQILHRAFPFLAAAAMIHTTTVSVTIYLHRHQTHRAIGYIHPALSHFFRFWLWLTTGINTKEWVAIHHKHHAYVDVAGDPHSPNIFGLPKVFFFGWLLYRREAKNKETLEKYGKGTPHDWVERNIYAPHNFIGLLIMLGTDYFLFGLPGILIWAAQMVTLPLLGAGIVNGFGHSIGYRTFNTPDKSKNFLPFGILMVGEELHNNHHQYPWSARLKSKRWEFDLGWFYIKGIAAFGLMREIKVVP